MDSLVYLSYNYRFCFCDCGHLFLNCDHNRHNTNIVSQFFIFVPLLTYDERRVAAQRNFCCPCIVHENKEYDIDQIVNTVTDPTVQASKHDNEQSSSNIKFSQKMSIEYMLTHILVPLLSKRIFRIGIIVLFFGWFAASIFSLQYLDTETDTMKLVPDDSFLVDFRNTLESGYGDVVFSRIEFVVENRDFSDETARNQVLTMFDTFETSFQSDYGSMIGEFLQWVDDFDVWIQSTFNISVDNIDDPSTYYQYLQIFANDTAFKQWDSEIIYDDDDIPTKIKATRVEF